MLLTSVPDPHSQTLKAFSSLADYNYMYTELSTVATEIAVTKNGVPTGPKKKLKLTGALQLMDYQESSDGGGSSPCDVSGPVEQEITVQS